MVKFIKQNIVIGAVFFIASCATSMTPTKVNNTLPTLTASKSLSQSQAEEAIKSNRCKYLVRGRNYTAPMGLTVRHDLKNGAKGIDEWVELDGGNAYVLISYKWITVDHNGSTQLHIEFDTMLCE
ncbi:hypothetical protein ACFLR8_01440 [Bacteroidota bacterium]